MSELPTEFAFFIAQMTYFRGAWLKWKLNLVFF